MRLCYISGSFPPHRDGVGDFAWHIAKILPELGFDDLMIVLKPEVNFPDGYKVIKTNFNHHELNAVRNKIIKFKPDLVLIEYPCTGYGKNLMINMLPIMLKLSDRLIKIALTVHEYSDYTWKGKIRIAIMCLAANKVMVTDRNNLILLSKIKNNLKAILPVPPQIPITVKKDYALSTKGLTFAFWGFVRPDKGLHLLLSAFTLFIHDNPKAKLHLYTELGDTEYQKAQRDYIIKESLTEQIKITGFLDDESLSRVLSDSDVCVLPFIDGVSDRRGSLKACLAMGIPVISTEPSVNNSPEGLLNDENIILCKPDVESLLAAMKKMKGEKLRNRLGRNAYEWGKTQNWGTIKKILSKVLKD